MKRAVMFSAMSLLAAAATGVAAQEVGQVISSTPVVQQVAVPRQVCGGQPQAMQAPSSGAGAVVGAIAGAAVGNAIGHGTGRAVATMLGMIGGAALGDSLEGSGAAVQAAPPCTTQSFYESRTVGYDVTYEYAGKQYRVQLPNDPGPTIALQINPVGAVAPNATPPEGTYAGAPAPGAYPAYAGRPYSAPYPAPYPAPYYAPYYYAPSYYAPAFVPMPFPIGLSLNLGYSRNYSRMYAPAPTRRWR